MSAGATETIKETSRLLLDSMEPYDAFDIICHIWFANMPLNAETYKETEHRGLMVIVELAAQLLLQRKSREGSGDRTEFIQGPLIMEWDEQLRDVIVASSVKRLADLGGDGKDFDSVRQGILNYELFLRNPAFENQEEETDRALFSPVADDLKKAVGFDIDVALKITDFLTERPVERLFDRRDQARAGEEALWRDSELLRQGKPAPGGDVEAASHLAAMPRKDARKALKNIIIGWMWLGIGDTLQVTIDEAVAATGASNIEVEAFLRFFGLNFGDVESPTAASGTNPVRDHPIIHDGSGNYLCVSGADLFFSLRSRLEGALKDAGDQTWERYNRVRTRFLEQRSVDLLESALRPEAIYRNLTYKVGEEKFETDGLLILDTAAIIVEAKGRSLTEPARRAAPARLRTELSKIVGDANDQVSRLRQLIGEGKTLDAKDENGTAVSIDCSNIRRIFSVVVTLEDLAWVSTTLWELLQSGVLPEGEELPLVLSLHDLEIITDLTEYPALFIHYLTRRSLINRDKKVDAPDELDLFVYYLKNGLFFEDWLKEKDAPDRIQLLSQTDDLDAYYLWKLGIKRKKVKKPAQKMSGPFRRFIEFFESQRMPGFLEASLMLLTLGGDSRKQFISFFNKVRRLTRNDSDIHNGTMVVCTEPSFGITFMCGPWERREAVGRRLEVYCQAKKYQCKTDMWLGMGVLTGSRDPFEIYFMLYEPWEQSDALEDTVKTLGLPPVTPCDEVGSSIPEIVEGEAEQDA